jgi:hypothetical protein
MGEFKETKWCRDPGLLRDHRPHADPDSHRPHAFQANVRDDLFPLSGWASLDKLVRHIEQLKPQNRGDRCKISSTERSLLSSVQGDHDPVLVSIAFATHGDCMLNHAPSRPLVR